MNRCLPLPSSRTAAWRTTLAVSLLCLSASAMAQLTVRPFPPAAQRGAMQITTPPELLLNGKQERLSPGARIRGTNNMLVMSAALTGQNLVVNYVREPQGLIHEVWILNAAEANIPLATKP